MTLFMALCDLVKHLKLEADGDNVRDVGSRYVLMTLHELRETPPVAIRSTNEVVCLRIEMIGNRLAGDRQFALVLTRAPTYEPLQLRSVVRIERDAAGMDFVDGCPATAIAETTDVSTFRVCVPSSLLVLRLRAAGFPRACTPTAWSPWPRSLAASSRPPRRWSTTRGPQTCA